MTETQVLRAVRASVDAHGIYVTANRIGVTHSTLTRYLAGMHCQAHVVERIATFAGKPPKPAVAKPAKKAKASKKSKPKKAKKAKPAKAKAKPSKKKASKPKAKKASKPKAKAPPAPASSPTVVDDEEASPAAAE